MKKTNTAKKATQATTAKTATKNSLRRKVSATGKNSKAEKSGVVFTGNNIKLKAEKIDTGKKAKFVTPHQRENTNSVNGKVQQRSCGTRKEKNAYGHFVGTIGAKIDTMIEAGTFTKKQIEAFAGTKMSKVNSHINHLRKDKNVTVNAPRGGVVSFG